MTSSILSKRASSQVIEVATDKATPQQLAEVNAEMALGFSVDELAAIQETGSPVLAAASSFRGRRIFTDVPTFSRLCISRHGGYVARPAYRV